MYDEIPAVAVAERIRQRRTQLGLSFQALADMTETSKSTLQRYEKGDIRNIPLHKLGALARALSTTPDWLIGWTDEISELAISDMDFCAAMEAFNCRFNIYGSPRKIVVHSTPYSGTITEEEFLEFKFAISKAIQTHIEHFAGMAHYRESVRIQSESRKLHDMLDIIRNNNSDTPPENP